MISSVHLNFQGHVYGSACQLRIYTFPVSRQCVVRNVSIVSKGHTAMSAFLVVHVVGTYGTILRQLSETK